MRHSTRRYCSVAAWSFFFLFLFLFLIFSYFPPPPASVTLLCWPAVLQDALQDAYCSTRLLCCPAVLACSDAGRVLLDSPTPSYRLYYRLYCQLYYLNALDVAVDDGGDVLGALLLEKQHLLVQRCVERCPRPCVSASTALPLVLLLPCLWCF